MFKWEQGEELKEKGSQNKYRNSLARTLRFLLFQHCLCLFQLIFRSG